MGKSLFERVGFLPVIAGGAPGEGEGEGSNAGSPPAGDKAPPEVVEDDFTPPEDLKDEKSKARFQKLVDRAKAAETAVAGYKDFGTPEQLQEYVEYAQGLEGTLKETQARIKTLEDKREPGEAKTEEQRKLEASRESIRKQMREHEPILTEMEKFLEEHKAEKAARLQALTLDAVEATADVMKRHGMPVSADKVQDMCDTLEPIIRKHPRLRFRFERNPEATIASAMDIYLENAKVVIETKTRLESQRAKEQNKGLPRPHGGGGGPGTGKTQEPAKSIAEGVTRGLARWREGKGA